MPFEIDHKTKKITFSFNNFLATLVVLGCFVYFFWISGPSKQSENRDIGEIKTALISVLTLVLGFYYGSTKNVAAKDAKINELQETAKELALTTASSPGKETKVETLNTENISGNVTADTVVTNTTDGPTPVEPIAPEPENK